MIVSGSPRRDWNTEKAFARSAEGLADEGLEVETVRLYDIEYKGCVSCLACKLKNSKTDGLCAYRDALTPILQKAREADVVVVGSPVYYSQATGQMRCFLERWLFPIGSYLWEDGKQKVFRDKVVPTGLIFTMNCPQEMMERYNYPTLLSDNANVMKAIMGHNELLYICNTYQFKDYGRYDFNLFSEEEKRKYRDEHFDEDLSKAYDLGRRLGEEAKRIASEQRYADNADSPTESHMADIMIRKRKRMRSKEVKALAVDLERTLGVPVFDGDDPVDMAESSEYDVIFVGPDILGLVYDGKPFLTIRGILAYRPVKRAVTVDMGAVPFVTNGADVMGPGITDADADIQEGDLVWIRDVKNGQPLAVGAALRSGEALLSKQSGKAIKTIHFVGDKLWKTGE